MEGPPEGPPEAAPVLVAVAQVTSGADKALNAAGCAGLVRRAAARGARLVFLPEAFDFVAEEPAQSRRLAEPLAGDLLRGYAGLARECAVWLSLGGFHEQGPDWESSGRVSNCHLLLDPAGKVAAAYRKTHLCDLELEGGVSLRESSFTSPGTEIVAPVQTPAGKLGLCVCYDLRFPELSLALRRAGAELLAFPSAFTVPTGSAHWEVLLRARAIETQCYVVAAAQSGRHHGRRESYGHSMVVDPWGTVVAQCREGPGLCFAEIDLGYLGRVRRGMPLERQRRPDLYGTVRVLAAPDGHPRGTPGGTDGGTEEGTSPKPAP